MAGNIFHSLNGPNISPHSIDMGKTIKNWSHFWIGASSDLGGAGSKSTIWTFCDIITEHLNMVHYHFFIKASSNSIFLDRPFWPKMLIFRIFAKIQILTINFHPIRLKLQDIMQFGLAESNMEDLSRFDELLLKLCRFLLLAPYVINRHWDN